MKRLRSVLELFNRCLDVCEDMNEARLTMADVLGKILCPLSLYIVMLTPKTLEYLLQLFAESIRHLRQCPTGMNRSSINIPESETFTCIAD
jgi:hypothetical protein